MTSLTVDNNKIEATELSVRTVTPHKSFISMQCYGHFIHTEIRRDLEEEEVEKDDRQVVYFIELEGLKMEFSNTTQIIRARKGVRIEDFNDFTRDHTSAGLIYNDPKDFKYQKLHQLTFFKNETNDNVYVSFPNSRDDHGYDLMYFDSFKEIKRDFISLLSFVNGAEVKIRKEFIGGFYNIGIVNTQTIITYSNRTIKNERYNDYVPLNHGFNRGANILNYVFTRCFNKYITENKVLDLNSIIFHLNGTQPSNRIEEKFFVQIIAFERLAQKYIESVNFTDEFLIDDLDFQPIKKDLLMVLKSNSEIIGKNLNKLSSKIGEIHKIKRTSTAFKFLKLLEYANIDINDDIQDIIDEVRHKSIHHGEIGGGEDGVRNYLVLDQLLRDIILNVIGYDRYRNSRLD